MRLGVEWGVVVVLATLVLALPGSAAAAPADLDPTFGTNGLVSTSVGAATTVRMTRGLVRQSDGSLVLAGGLWPAVGSSDIVLVRYTTGGSLDPTFGVNGIVTTDLGGPESAAALVVQPDDRLLVVARRLVGAGERLDLLRYGPNGALELVTATPIDGSSGGWSGLALQPDGKILVAGATGPSGVDLVRYTAAGALDPSFGAGGTVNTPLGGLLGLTTTQDIVVQTDGRIVVKAVSGIGTELARYEPNGTLDASFGTAGHARLFQPFSATSLVLLPDGKLVMGGLWSCGTACDFGLVRLTAAGSFDASFGANGIVTTDLGGQEAPYALVRQPDGKLVLAGGTRAASPENADFALVRYTAGGALDPGFGGDGTVTTDTGGDDVAYGLVVQPDGKIVAAGDGYGTSPAPPTRFVLARYVGGSDATPPRLTVPDAVSVNATSPAGAEVEYGVTATDDVDPSPDVTCSPPSGSLFPIGTTTVDCTSTDASGNTARASFTVHVRGAAEQLADLGVAVEGLGPGTSLADKVSDAQTALAEGNVRGACSVLRAFANQVGAQSGVSLPPGTATALLVAADRVRAVLGCR